MLQSHTHVINIQHDLLLSCIKLHVIGNKMAENSIKCVMICVERDVGEKVHVRNV